MKHWNIGYSDIIFLSKTCLTIINSVVDKGLGWNFSRIIIQFGNLYNLSLQLFST